MRKLSRKTLTKRITYSMLVISVICANIPYILSLFGREPVEELGIAWVTSVTVVCLGYFVRGYKDSKSEADIDYKHRRLDIYENNIESDT